MNEAAHKPVALLVEDDPRLMDVLPRLLQAKGYEVVLVDSGQEAIAKMAAGLHPDLLVTDWGLTDGNTGWKVVGDARERNHQIPVVMLTGQPNAAPAVAADDGVDAASIQVVGKPIEMAVFFAAIDEAIAQATMPGKHVKDLGQASGQSGPLIG